MTIGQQRPAVKVQFLPWATGSRDGDPSGCPAGIKGDEAGVRWGPGVRWSLEHQAQAWPWWGPVARVQSLEHGVRHFLGAQLWVLAVHFVITTWLTNEKIGPQRFGSLRGVPR